jgi:hypothetical protein
MDSIEYLATEVQQIIEAYNASDKSVDIDTFAIAWVQLNGEKFEQEHPRD